MTILECSDFIFKLSSTHLHMQSSKNDISALSVISFHLRNGNTNKTYQQIFKQYIYLNCKKIMHIEQIIPVLKSWNQFRISCLLFLIILGFQRVFIYTLCGLLEAQAKKNWSNSNLCLLLNDGFKNQLREFYLR